MVMEKQLKQFYKFLEVDKKVSNNTLQSYKRDLKQFSEYLDEKGIKYTNHTTLPLRAFPTFLYPFHRYRRTKDNTQCNSTCHLKSFQSHRGSHPAMIHDQVVRGIIDSGTRN